ncbi:MAG: VCBS repeat-containing protein [Verrucomicrobiales bacterium]
MGVLWFDAEGDGDQDLFVVSGGVECDPGAPTLQDRLYLNAGEGRFLPAPEGSVPAGLDSGSVAAAADWDRDGDLDLFIGGRIVPGQYPLPARSHLLVNDGRGHFQDLPDGSNPSFPHHGLVTSALWTDADGDGWPDLLLAQEWGPLCLFHNDQGRGFTDRTRDAGLAPHTGWWNSLAGRDLDGDGDIDYVAGNTGLNTKYKTAPGHPELLFYGDLDGTGHPRIVEAKIGSPNGDASDCLLPRRGFSCSSQAMPFLRQKWAPSPTSRAVHWSRFTPRRLAKARRFEASTLESAVFLNDGEGHFTVHPLPRLAQISGLRRGPDRLQRGRPHRLLSRPEFFQPSTGNGRHGRGPQPPLGSAGDGTFQPLWPLQSGLGDPGDAKSAAVADLNEDGRPDLVLGVNQGPLQTFLSGPPRPH